MGIASENFATVSVVLLAIGILGWGLFRARPYGKLGILAWLQSVSLMIPWLAFFGLFAVGIYLNLAVILFLLVSCTALYIFLGRRLRAAGQEQILRDRAAARLQQEAQVEPTEQSGSSTPPTKQGAQQTAGLPETTLLKMPLEDIKTIQGLFGIDTFFATETISYQEGVLFKGNLRGELETTFAHLSAGLQERLGDRYRLFLLEGLEGKPVVIVLPSHMDPPPTTQLQKILAIVLMLATVATSFETVGFFSGFDFYQNLGRIGEILPMGLSILAILAAHEIGHLVMARRHHVRWSLPFFIPTWQIATLGALNRFESWLPNRKVLFDVAFAGPAAGGVLAFVMLLIGLLLSHPESGVQMPASFFQGSILVGTLARVVLGSGLHQAVVHVHPLVVVGWLGLIINALNLMPAGQLDGGRIVQAIYGRKTAGRTTVATLILLAIAALVNPLALYWAIVILFLQRELERPSFNELTEPDDARAALGILALFLMITTLIPLTPSLAGRLGIGG
jgi:membrane-associated protease RseP (regulator of RpoE activity)